MGFGDLISGLFFLGLSIASFLLIQSILLLLWFPEFFPTDIDLEKSAQKSLFERIWCKFVGIAAVLVALLFCWKYFWEFAFCFDSLNNCQVLGGDTGAFEYSSHWLIPFELHMWLEY
jgi:hypothetical protein